MDPISISSGIAGLITLALQVGDTVSAYVDAIRSRAEDVKELHEELLLLGDVLSRLRDFLNSEKAKGSTFDEDSILQRAISDCKARIERIGDRIRLPQGGKLARAVNHLKWPFEKKEVLQMMENLRRYRSTFEFAIGIQGCKILSKASEDANKSLKQMLELSKRTEEMYAQQGLIMEGAAEQSARMEQVLSLLPLLKSSANDFREVSQAVQLAELREQERRTTEILNWLAPVESLHKHRDVQARRAKGTGQHFLQSKEFKQWVQAEDACDMLCMGGPGVGKSVLCSLVIDELKQRYKDSDTAIAYYYCDYAEQQAQSAAHFAQSILRQICVLRGTLPSAVAEFYQRTRNEIKDQTWFQELQTLLRRIMATFSSCILVIDALDETEAIKQRTELLGLIDTMRSASGTMKIFATARPHLSNIEDRLRRPITAQVSAQDADLRVYLSSMIDAHPEADDIIDVPLKEEILNRLCANAGGIFLLPSLQIRNILDQPTRGDIRESLKDLSSDLTAVFSSTIDRIRALSGARRNVAMKSLMWVSHTRKPLTSIQLRHVLALRPGDTSLNQDNMLSLRTIIDSCFGLLELEQDSNTVRLVHFSLEEFLQSQDHNLFEDANLVILRTCLQYLGLEPFKALPFKNRADFDRTLREMPFLEYACMEWGHHAKRAKTEEYQDLALPLLNDSQKLLTLARVRDAKSPDFRKWRERMWAWALSKDGGAGISLAASYGLTDLLRLLLNQQTTPNLLARNMYGSTPLHECAIYGHEEAAEVLIANGADLLDQNKGKATPFFLAISYDRLSMAQLLLKYNRAQLDSHCKGGMTPLIKAVDVGSERLVEYLLSQGALVAAVDYKGHIALHHAAINGRLAIARLLVLAGSPVHFEAKDGVTPLDQAATAGHRDVAQYLIDNGGHVSHRASDNWSLLNRAARGGHVDTLVLLLEKGAEVLDRDYRGNTSLHHAARSGHLETVVQLLEYEPHLKSQQLFARDKRGSTPREVAFYCAQYRIHKYLRSAEWDVLGVQPSSSSKMTAAIEAGDQHTIETLLATNPSQLEQPDDDGQPPLHVALQENQLSIARYLISAGASIESTGYHGWHPLHIASSLGNLDAVNLCLLHGADITVRTATQQTCLHKAASSRSLPVLRRLVSAGADLHTARNDRGMTALHIASHQNDIVIVRALVLEYGMDVLQTDARGTTATGWAEKSAHLDVLAFLRGEEKKARGVRGEIHADLERESQVERGGGERSGRRGRKRGGGGRGRGREWGYAHSHSYSHRRTSSLVSSEMGDELEEKEHDDEGDGDGVVEENELQGDQEAAGEKVQRAMQADLTGSTLVGGR